jgi:thioredoxin-like negative regulator of GroEL
MRAALLSVWALTAAAASQPPPAAPAGRSARASAPEPLRFIENDYPGALAEARRRQIPLFVDAWAPWCHTCRFLRSYVLNDPALARYADRFVWLSLDTEQVSAQPFLERIKISSWPTLLILDPSDEKPVLRWLGSLSVQDLATVLEIGERRVLEGRKPGGAGPAPADQASTGLDPLLARRPHEPASRLGATEALVLSLQEKEAFEACARAAALQCPALARGAAFASAVAAGLYCAVAAPEPGSLAVLEPLGEEALKIPDLLVDDRSSVYEVLVDVREKRGDKAGARSLAASWFAFLSAEYQRAPNAEARSAFDPHLVAAALAMGEPQRSLPALAASERDLPSDYNAAARAAIVYRELGRYPEALAAIDRALLQAHGPRRVRLLEVRSSICVKRGDPAGARAALQDAIHFGEALPKGQRPDSELAHVRELLAELS